MIHFNCLERPEAISYCSSKASKRTLVRTPQASRCAQKINGLCALRQSVAISSVLVCRRYVTFATFAASASLAVPGVVQSCEPITSSIVVWYSGSDINVYRSSKASTHAGIGGWCRWTQQCLIISAPGPPLAEMHFQYLRHNALKMLNDSTRAFLNLKTMWDGVRGNIGSDLPGYRLDLGGLLRCPH